MIQECYTLPNGNPQVTLFTGQVVEVPFSTTKALYDTVHFDSNSGFVPHILQGIFEEIDFFHSVNWVLENYKDIYDGAA